MDLNNKRILLTGATGGIGSVLARQLAEQGANLVLVGRQQVKLDTLKASLVNPTRHLTVTADLSTPAGVDVIDVACQAWREAGILIDIVINNAGNNTFAFLAQRESASIQQEFQLNVITPILLSQKALSWLNRPSLILNVGSTFGAIGYPGYSTYCANKAALHRFSEALQRELSGTSIDILYVAPRATETSLNDHRITELNQILGNKMDKPEAVAVEIMNALIKEKQCLWLGWPEKLFVRINQLFPQLVAKSIRKQHAQITEFINKDLNENTNV